MLSLTATQQAIIDSAFKKVDWLFTVKTATGTAYYWSTKHCAASGSEVVWDTTEDWDAYVHWNVEDQREYTFNIVDFNGVELYRMRAEQGVVAASSASFTVLNPGSSMTPSDFNNGDVWIALRVSNGTTRDVIRRWRFKIKKTEPGYQQFNVVCEDFLQHYLRGFYPNTKLVRDILTTTADVDSNACVPVVFGTAYIPLKSSYLNSAVSVTGTTISATASTGPTVNCVISDSASGFGYIELGRYVTVSGFTETNNNGTFLVYYATESRIELSPLAGIVTEAAGDSITITQGSRYYLLGEPTNAYRISEVRSPRAWGKKSIWQRFDWGGNIQWGSSRKWNGCDLEQFTKTSGGSSWRLLQPMIADADNDGIPDSCGLWKQGDAFLDMPVKFDRQDTKALTNPANVLDYILMDMGVTDIDKATFQSAYSTFGTWGLTWNGGFWFKRDRKQVLAQLLCMCHANLVTGEKVELYPYSKTSRKTITENEVLKTNEVGMGTFRYQDVRPESIEDSGYVGWQEAGESQDTLIKTLVAADGGTSYTNISSRTIEVPWVQDSQKALALGVLFHQRSLLKEADVSFQAKSTCLALNPGDVVTIDSQNYGGGTVDDETGATWGPTVHGLSLADGAAFFKASGVDLADYAGTEGSDTPYELVLHDSAGKIARGWIGAVDAYVDLLWQTGNSWQSNVAWDDPSETLGVEIVTTNGDFESAGGGGGDVFLGWTEVVGDGAIADESTIVHGGSHSAKITTGPTYNTSLQGAVGLTVGKLYQFTIWVYGDGTNSGLICVYGASGFSMPWTSVSHTEASWTKRTFKFTAIDVNPTIYLVSANANGAITYFDDVSIREVTHTGPIETTVEWTIPYGMVYGTPLTTEPTSVAHGGVALSYNGGILQVGEWGWAAWTNRLDVRLVGDIDPSTETFTIVLTTGETVIFGPAAHGVHIVSSQHGSTQSWASVESGFNYNDTAYTFEVTRRYPVVIDSMRINKDLSVGFSCSKYSHALDDFTDLSPAAATVYDDDSYMIFTPALTGPVTSPTPVVNTTTGVQISGTPPTQIPATLQVGDNIAIMTATSAGLPPPRQDRLTLAGIEIDGVNTRIRSTNYVSGSAGFTLEPDLLEVGNIVARGMIKTAVFQKSVISAVGGNVLVLPADTLATDMTAADCTLSASEMRTTVWSDMQYKEVLLLWADSSWNPGIAWDNPAGVMGATRWDQEVEWLSLYHMVTSDNETFVSGHALRIKDGSQDEWFKVFDASEAPTYKVQRDRKDDYNADQNPAWTKGATIVNYQRNGDGGILLTSSENNAPFIDIISHSGKPWTDLQTRARFGNLNGYLGYNSDAVGIAIGDDSGFLKYDPVNGLRIKGTLDLSSSSLITAALLLSGGYIRTSSSYPYIEMSGTGIQLKTGDTGGSYGTGVYSTDTYGSGALAWIFNSSMYIPWAEMKEPTNASAQGVASLRLYSRADDPDGPAVIGDICVVGGKLKICTVAGTPGTWTVVGAQTA